jgi:glycosyltransferase involved in cell wall biosynthesis
MESRKIAVLCNYKLLPERVGGMDHFFWQFDATSKANNIQVDWFFPNRSLHGDYGNLNIFDSNNQNVDAFFLDFCSQNNPNYTHIVTHFVELCTPFFKKIKQVTHAKIIAIDHNPRPINGYAFKKRLGKKVKGFLYSKYIDQFIGVSQYTRNHILKDYGFFLAQKTSVIYNGIDTSIFVKRTKVNKNRFVVCSHLRESKGIQDLLQAVSVLENEIKNQIQIDIYGEGPFENELVTMANHLHLNQIVFFKGSTSNLYKLLANYSYLLQPTYMECFSLSILESLAANVPVITTTVGGNLEIIEHNKNGFIFEPKDFLALSAILNQLVLGNLNCDQDVSLQVQNDFNLEKMVNEHIQVLG